MDTEVFLGCQGLSGPFGAPTLMSCREAATPATSRGNPTREAPGGASRVLLLPMAGNRSALTQGQERGAMAITKHSIDVDVPAHSAYEQWSRFEELPRFMDGVQEVRRLDGTRLKWVADICGERVEWYGKVTEDVTDTRLAWQSDDGLVNSGAVTFKELGHDQTRVTLEIEHDEASIAAAISGRLAGGLGDVTEGDLETFKEIIEDQEDEKDLQRASAK